MKVIRISEENYEKLKKRRHWRDTANNIITRLLEQKLNFDTKALEPAYKQTKIDDF